MDDVTGDLGRRVFIGGSQPAFLPTAPDLPETWRDEIGPRVSEAGGEPGSQEPQGELGGPAPVPPKERGQEAVRVGIEGTGRGGRRRPRSDEASSEFENGRRQRRGRGRFDDAVDDGRPDIQEAGRGDGSAATPDEDGGEPFELRLEPTGKAELEDGQEGQPEMPVQVLQESGGFTSRSAGRVAGVDGEGLFGQGREPRQVATEAVQRGRRDRGPSIGHRGHYPIFPRERI